MTDYRVTHKYQIRKWRKLAKERESERDILASMIDHLEIQIREYFPNAFSTRNPCYGEVIDTTIELLAELERGNNVQDKPNRAKRKGSRRVSSNSE